MVVFPKLELQLRSTLDIRINRAKGCLCLHVLPYADCSVLELGIYAVVSTVLDNYDLLHAWHKSNRLDYACKNSTYLSSCLGLDAYSKVFYLYIAEHWMSPSAKLTTDKACLYRPRQFAPALQKTSCQLLCIDRPRCSRPRRR